MIGTSLLEYVFIRACIIGLQSVAPLCIIYCLTWGFSRITNLPLLFDAPLPFKFWALIEVIFYIFVNVIYREKLQYEALHPPAPPRNKRKELFELCNNNIPDPEAYLRKWFLGQSANEIKRDNVKEFFLWAFFNRDGPPGEDDEELEEYVVSTEILLGRKIEEGRGNAVCLRLTIDGVNIYHRSILWYLVSHASLNESTPYLINTTVCGIRRLFDLRTLTLLRIRLLPDGLSAVLEDIPRQTSHTLPNQSLSSQTTHLLVSPSYVSDKKTCCLHSRYRNWFVSICQLPHPIGFSSQWREKERGSGRHHRYRDNARQLPYNTHGYGKGRNGRRDPSNYGTS
jgi:hypothetical protein